MDESNSTDVNSLIQNLEIWRQRCVALEHEKAEMNSSFEEKRSKFKELYTSKEKLLADQHSKIETLERKLNEYEETIAKMQVEIEDVKMIASVSENTKQEAVENLNKRHMDEIESLRRAMEDSNEDTQQDLVRHFERERRQWERKMSMLTSEKGKLDMEVRDLRKKIHREDLSEEEELEESMKKAHEEAEKLKSVVVPLEQEISKLKQELEESQKKLIDTEKAFTELKTKSSKKEKENLIEVDSSRTTEDESVTELDHSLKCEKSSRTDLERYVEVLQEQKKSLTEENEKWQKEVKESCERFEAEKYEHAVLKEKWLAANDQFLVSQRLLMRDNKIVEGVLSEEQKKQVKLLKLKAQASEARDATVTSPTTSHALLKEKMNKFKEAVADSFSNKSDTDSDSQSFGSFQDFQEVPGEHSKEKLSDKLKLELHSEDQYKTSPPQDEIVNADKIVPGPGQKVILEAEWSKLQLELRRLRRKLDLSSNSSMERKHTDLFDDDAKMTAEIDNLKEKIELMTQEKEKNLRKIQSLEESIQYSAESAQKQMFELSTKLSDFERMLGTLKEKRIKAKAEDIHKLLELSKERDKLREDFISLKKEKEKHATLQDKHHQNLSRDNSTMPKSIEGMRQLVKMYREALATARAEHENKETKLQNDIVFLKDQLKVEQNMKDELETSLASELHDARGEIISLQSLKSVKDELDQSLKEKEELKLMVERSKSSVESVRSKSNEIIKGLKEKLQEDLKAKEALEKDLAETKNKLRSLQSALETSETVQRDFVRLSQSLQVQLAQVHEEREHEKALSESGSVKSLEMASPGHSVNHEPQERLSPRPSPKLTQRVEIKKPNI